MGTEYRVYKDSKVELSLYEMSCTFWVQMSIQKPDNHPEDPPPLDCSSDHKLTEDEILDMATNLIGPLYYFSDHPEMILDTLKDKLQKRGFL